MKPLIASLVFLLVTITPTLAPSQETVDPPAHPLQAKIVLKAPSNARIGELIRLDVSESIGDSFEWLLVPGSATTDFEVYAEGRKAVFSARTDGEYRFIVACAKDGTVNVVTHVIQVSGPPPTPATDSLAEWIPFWLWQYELPDEERLALAKSFESVAAREAELKTAEEWIKATAEANREALGDSIENWAPVLDKIGTVLLKRAQDGQLITPEQHREMWLEIAAGLRKG